MKNIYSLLLKEKATIIRGFVAGTFLFIVYLACFYTPLYSTELKLLVRNIPKSDVINAYGSGPIVQSESGFSNPLFNLMQILTSQDMSSRMYRNILHKYPDDLKKLRIASEKDWQEKFQDLVKVKNEPSTDIITVYLNWPDKSHSVDVLNTIVSEFRAINLGIRRSVETRQGNYLTGQIAQIGRSLDAIRHKIRNYKIANNITDTDNEAIELIKARIELQKQAALLRGDIGYNSKKLANLLGQLKFPNAASALRATSIGEDPYLVKLQQDLATAQQNYAKLDAQFTDNYPDVIAAKNEIASLKKNIMKRKQESLGHFLIRRGLYDKPSQDIVTDIARTEAEKYSLNTRLAILQRGIRDLSGRESRLPSKVFGLEELTKQENALIEAYNTAKQSQLEARIKENEIDDNIFPLGQPIFPSFLLSILLMKFAGFEILGFLGAIAFLWIKGSAETKWNNISEIEELTGETILGSIPWFKSRGVSVKEFDQLSSSLTDIVYGDISTGIIAKSYLEKARAISFISTGHTRDESLIVSNIAITLARFKKSVILVDTNFVQPCKLLKDLGLDIPPGKKDLLDVIIDIEDHMSNSSIIDREIIAKSIEEALIDISVKIDNNNTNGLYYLGCCRKTDNIYEFVAVQAFKEIINYLKTQYEFVLIETPNKSYLFPEFSIIADASDAVAIIDGLLTSKNDLLSAIKKFKKLNTKILGIIPREENSELENLFNDGKTRLEQE